LGILDAVLAKTFLALVFSVWLLLLLLLLLLRLSVCMWGIRIYRLQSVMGLGLPWLTLLRYRRFVVLKASVLQGSQFYWVQLRPTLGTRNEPLGWSD
jgi:hypothetical protein